MRQRARGAADMRVRTHSCSAIADLLSRLFRQRLERTADIPHVDERYGRRLWLLLGAALQALDEGQRSAERLDELPDALLRELDVVNQLSEQLMEASSPRQAVLLARDLLIRTREARRLAAVGRSNGAPG